MSDLGLSVAVTRSLLGLDDLDINDGIDYLIGPNFMGGQQSWQRTTVGSPFFDGQVTTYRQRQNVTEPIQIEVFGEDVADVIANCSDVVDAFNQDTYIVNIQVGNQNLQYQFEAADLQMPWTGPRFLATQLQLNFQAIRRPLPLNADVSV